jgi:hypothetical protein
MGIALKKAFTTIWSFFIKNWLLLLIAYFAYNAMVDASAARSWAVQAADEAEEAAYYAEEAAQNAAEAATQATDAAQRARQIYFSILAALRVNHFWPFYFSAK